MYLLFWEEGESALVTAWVAPSHIGGRLDKVKVKVKVFSFKRRVPQIPVWWNPLLAKH